MQSWVCGIGRPLLYDMLEEAILLGIGFHHASQRNGSQFLLLSFRQNTNCFFDAWHFLREENRRDDVWAGEPDRFLASQVVNSDILCCAVIRGTNGKNVFVGVNQSKELELW